jgi:hypothetical protein
LTVASKARGPTDEEGHQGHGAREHCRRVAGHHRWLSWHDPQDGGQQKGQADPIELPAAISRRETRLLEGDGEPHQAEEVRYRLRGERGDHGQT